MDRKFLLDGLLALIPLTLIFVFFFHYYPMTGDFKFHMDNFGSLDYPNGVAWVLSFITMLGVSRAVALFLFMLLVTTLIPYILIVEIVGGKRPEWKMTAGWVYLYGSGVPFVLMFGGVAAQAAIMCLMLLSVLEPMALFLFVFVGPFIYREWLLALFAAIGYVGFQKLKPKIPQKWYGQIFP